MTRQWPNRSGAVLVAATVFAVVSLLAPPPAGAHSNPAIVVRLSDVRPALPSGADLRVLSSMGVAAQLAVTNATETPVEVLEPTGEPFLRVSAKGVVGDVTSPYLAVPGKVVARATPAPADGADGRWMQLHDEGAWSWADPRLDAPLDPAALDRGDRGLASLDTGRPLATWEIGVRYGPTGSTVTGVLERRQSGRVSTTLETVPPGVTATVIDARRPQLVVETRPGTILEVLGRDERPVLRMGPQGTFARVDSPEYREHRLAIGLAPEAGTGWVRIAAHSRIQWADPRLRYSGERPAGAAEGTVALGRWRIPVLVDGQAADMVGNHAWETSLPALGTPSAASDAALDGPVPYLVGALLTAAVVAAYLLARRRETAVGARRGTGDR